MSDKNFNVKDNFARRYVALLKLKQYIYKWQMSTKLKFSAHEQGMLKRMLNSIDKSISVLEHEFTIMYKDTDLEYLRKYVKDDNGNKN